MTHAELSQLLTDVDPTRPIVFLTGAGISAESGIPTFRGPGGYWTVGSDVYKPQEIGTWAFFKDNPFEVWRWYLFRRGVCEQASPNTGHAALARLEQAMPDRFHLITQNIDGLHRIAGNSVDRTYEVHGNGHEMRCSVRCTADRYPIPDGVGSKDRETPLTDDEKALLVCPKCGAVARPHVLWFDEHYEEDFYRSDTAMRAALRAGLFVTVGTSGATSLPLHATAAAAETGAVILDINPNPNPFQAFATDYSRGMWLKGSSSERVPALVSLLIGE